MHTPASSSTLLLIFYDFYYYFQRMNFIETKKFNKKKLHIIQFNKNKRRSYKTKKASKYAKRHVLY